MEDVRLRRSQHMVQRRQKIGRPIRVFESMELPVVDDLDDREAFEDTPDQVAGAARRIEASPNTGHGMAAAQQRLAESRRVNLGSRLMPRQKIVDSVQEAEP